MPNATHISFMFADSPFTYIPIDPEKCPNVQAAYNLFWRCNRLFEFPNVKFKNLESSPHMLLPIGNSAQAVKTAIVSNPFNLTMDCRSPFSHNRAKASAWIKDLMQFIVEDAGKAPKTLTKNGKTLIVVDS